jgi:alpha/beta superfamily hydrolase
MKREEIMFPCGDISLEGQLLLPVGGGISPAVVVCHPHSLYGGNMDNSIVHGVCEALGRDSIASLRFNFRGVGKSGGRFADGLGEQEDVRAALSLLEGREEIDSSRLGLCGYSFGTMVGIPVADADPRIQALAGISPFFVFPGLLKSFTSPKYFICGSDDSFANPVGLEKTIGELPEPKEYEIISGADHFWWGYEEQVGVKVSGFFVGSLG